jgi:hypothetical protein
LAPLAAVAAEVASAVAAAGPVPVEPLLPQVVEPLLPQVVELLLPQVVGARRPQVVAELQVVAHPPVQAAAVSEDSAVALLPIRSYSAVTAGSLYTPGKPRLAVEPRSR